MNNPNPNLNAKRTHTKEKETPEETWLQKNHHSVLAGSTFFLFLATLVLAVGTFYLAYEIEDTRANKSIELLLFTVDKLGSGVECADFLADMSDEEIGFIFKHKSLNISPIHIDHLNRCLSGSENKGELLVSSKNSFTLTEYGSTYVERQFSHDINLLNIIASAYYSGSSNKKIIKDTVTNLMTAAPFKIVIEKIQKTGFEYYKSDLYRYIAEEYGYIPNKKP